MPAAGLTCLTALLRASTAHWVPPKQWPLSNPNVIFGRQLATFMARVKNSTWLDHQELDLTSV